MIKLLKKLEINKHRMVSALTNHGVQEVLRSFINDIHSCNILYKEIYDEERKKRRARPLVRGMMMRQHTAEVEVASVTITVPPKADMAQMPVAVAGVSFPWSLSSIAIQREIAWPLKLKITLRWICKKRKKTINALVMLKLTKMTKRMGMGEEGAKRGTRMTKEDVLCFDN